MLILNLTVDLASGKGHLLMYLYLCFVLKELAEEKMSWAVNQIDDVLCVILRAEAHSFAE